MTRLPFPPIVLLYATAGADECGAIIGQHFPHTVQLTTSAHRADFVARRRPCECGAPAVGTVDTGREDVPVCAQHAELEAAAGVEVTR